jgi:hypothetical protein
MINERVDIDSVVDALSEVVRVLDSNKVWGGQSYTYHPISPAKYLALKERVELELAKLL